MGNLPVEQRAGGVIFRKYSGIMEFLLVTSNSNKNKWIFPAGHIEKGETPERAALREVIEEAGVEAKIIGNLGCFQYFWYRENKKVIISTNLFLMEYLHTVKTNPEGRQVGFFKYEEVLALNIWEESRAFLEKAYRLLKRVAP
ncbi:MAG: NUDIX domain-containing protein [Bacillota bacterium]